MTFFYVCNWVATLYTYLTQVQSANVLAAEAVAARNEAEARVEAVVVEKERMVQRIDELIAEKDKVRYDLVRS